MQNVRQAPAPNPDPVRAHAREDIHHVLPHEFGGEPALMGLDGVDELRVSMSLACRFMPFPIEGDDQRGAQEQVADEFGVQRDQRRPRRTITAPASSRAMHRTSTGP